MVAVEDFYESISGETPHWSITSNVTDDQQIELPDPFDQLTQRMFFALVNGTARSFDFNQLDDELRFSVQWSTVYGVTIGMSIMALLHVLALTPVTKRRTLIYWMNLIGLSLVFVRGIFQTVFFRDRWVSFYVTFSGDADTVPILHRIHLTASVFLGIATLFTVEVIFFIQGRAILSSLQKKFYYPLMGLLCSVGIVTIAAKLVYVSYSMKDIWILRYMPVDSSNIPPWIQPVTLSTYVLSIGLWSLVWSCFIGRQILLRWKMNMMRGSTFGAMNVLFLAGIQSMIIPMFFLVMQFVPYDRSFWGAEGMVIPAVLCLMPFSCLWAGTISSTTGQGCDEPRSVGHGALQSTVEKVPFGKGLLNLKHKAFDDPEATLSGDTAAVHHNYSKGKHRSSNHIDKLYPTNDTLNDDDDEIEVLQTDHLHSEHSSSSNPNRSSSSK